MGENRQPSPRQLVALRHIALALDRREPQPSIKELGALMGVTSTNGVADHLRALERKGLVTRVPKTARSLRLTPLGWKVARHG